MSQVKRIVLCLALLLGICFYQEAYATTKAELITALQKTYVIAGKERKLPKKLVDRGVDFVSKVPMTEEQYEGLLNCIQKAVSIGNEVGTIDRKKMSKEDIQRFIPVVMEAAQIAGVDLEEEIKKSDVAITQTQSQVVSNVTKKDTKTESANQKPPEEKIAERKEYKATEEVSGDTTPVSRRHFWRGFE